MCSGATVGDRRLSLTMVRLSFSASFLFVVYRDSFCAICIVIIVYCTSISLHWHVGTWSSVSFHVLNHYFDDVAASLHGQKKVEEGLGQHSSQVLKVQNQCTGIWSSLK